jgi:hypothetical protein
VNPQKILADVRRIPVIGELIIAFAITVVLAAFSSACSYFGYEGEDKKMLLNIFIYIGFTYFIVALVFRGFFFIKKQTNKDK